MAALSTRFLFDYFRENSDNKSPILQVVDMKTISPERALIAVSDGVHATQALLSGPALELMNNQEISINCIVRLDAFAQAPRKVQLPAGVLIVQNLTVLERGRTPLTGITPLAQALAAAEASGGAAGASGAAAGASSMHAGPNQTNTTTSTPARNPYGATASSARQSPATYVSGGVQLTQIRAMNPYQRSWTIKARVTSKSDIRPWSNAKGQGKLFAIELLDQFGGQIRATLYQDACDKWFPVFKEGQVYLISRAQVRQARKTGFNRLINDYELTIESSSEVTPVPDDGSIGAVGLTSRKTIGQINEMKIATTDASNSTTAGSTSGADDVLVDVVGVVVDCKPIAKIISKKSARELTKRDISIVDRSLLKIDLTLWGEQADLISEESLASAPTIVATACRVSDFNGRTLSTSFSSQIFVDPQMPECAELKKWYLTEGTQCQFTSVSSGSGSGSGSGAGARSQERKSFADFNEEHIRAVGQAEYLTVRATITNFKNERQSGKVLWYEGCPTCNRKVHEVSGTWTCDTCNTSFQAPSYVYNFSFQASDYQTSKWLAVFGNKGDAILGVPASIMAEYVKDQPDEYDRIISNVGYKQFEMRVQGKTQNRDGETVVRYQLMQATPIDFAEESRRLLKELSALQVQ